MVAPLLVPVMLVTATLTLRSDTKPVTVYVKKPRGTLYWGGAGLDGPYIQPQLKALQNAGIGHVSVGLTNSATKSLPPFPGTIVDAIRAGLLIRYEDNDEWTISSGMDTPAEQFNMVGYSYGSLLAAQTAWFYAKQGHIIDHLVLVGSPIDHDFLVKLKGHKNIKKIVVVDLKEQGDPIYAGMSQVELIEAAPKLGRQMLANKGEGHFYFAHVMPDSPNRWKALAIKLANEGLR